MAAMFPPCSVDGPTLTVRKFTHRYTLNELVECGTLSLQLAAELTNAVRRRRNVEPIARNEPGTFRTEHGQGRLG